METKQWTTVDKSKWERGEWTDEPDKMQWQDENTGLPCLIVRGSSGALCGYVGVSEGHPFYNVGYSDVMFKDADGEDEYPDAHGGLTYSDFCMDTGDESRHICHIPGAGEPDHVWWFGFDCAHSGDIMPREGMLFRCGYNSYKDIGYVKASCRDLAKQLHSVAR